MKRAYLGARAVPLEPGLILGEGGEAEVFAVEPRLALKVYKGPDHPDWMSAAERDAAALRLEVAQRKLPAFPCALPPSVAAPVELATERRRGGRIVGFSMPRVVGAHSLARLADPQLRRGHLGGAMVVKVLLALAGVLTELHREAIVVGDLNDLNVLVAAGEVWLIDADSFQFSGFPCSVFSERFVDPLLCEPRGGSPVQVRPYAVGSDWYAFSVLAFQSLLGVGPHGGVFRPRTARPRVPAQLRALERVTIFDAEVVYPRPALPLSTLPDELLHAFRRIFEGDQRGPFACELLSGLRFQRCVSCGLEHARDACPSCTVAATLAANLCAQAPGNELVAETDGVLLDVALWPDRARGTERLVWVAARGGALVIEDGTAVGSAPLHPARVRRHANGVVLAWAGHVEQRTPGRAPERSVADSVEDETSFATHGAHRFWVEDGRLLRDGPHGPVTWGRVVRGRTRLWVGERLGLGFCRAQGLKIGFLFSTQHPGIDDRLSFPDLEGTLIHANAILSDERAWLFTLHVHGGRRSIRCTVVTSDARLLASCEAPADAAGWLGSNGGAAAVGDVLLVPTDEGVVRVERRASELVIARTFPETASVVDAASTLRAGRDALYVAGARTVHRFRLA